MIRSGDRIQTIALEEHYLDSEIFAAFEEIDRDISKPLQDRLFDFDKIRLKEMDDAGIDIQVISHSAPAVQNLPASVATPLACRANDRLFDVIGRANGRLAGFAILPTPSPEEAADELERAVTKLGLKGGIIHGPTHGIFLDDKRFWPIFERAQDLDVPLYLHPARPQAAVVSAYFEEYARTHKALLSAGWGFTVETATHAIRLILSGVFDAYPRTKMILGHLGESLPFSLWRTNMAFAREQAPGARSFRDHFAENFYLTTSGNFSTPALLCCIMEMGIDRILFSVDWPFVQNRAAVDWATQLPLSKEDRVKILSGNAARLLKL